MQRQTQAEIFVQTLEELLDAEREIQRARRLRQQKAAAKRYIQAFPAASDESRMQFEHVRRANGSGLPTGVQMQSD